MHERMKEWPAHLPIRQCRAGRLSSDQGSLVNVIQIITTIIHIMRGLGALLLLILLIVILLHKYAM